MKIYELAKINMLHQKASCLLNAGIDLDFYDLFSTKEVAWLLENRRKIEKDFFNNKNNIKFLIIMNTTLPEREELILSINTLEEFNNYINIAPFKFLRKRVQNKTVKLFNEFMKLSGYKRITFFEKNRRR